MVRGRQVSLAPLTHDWPVWRGVKRKGREGRKGKIEFTSEQLVERVRSECGGEYSGTCSAKSRQQRQARKTIDSTAYEMYWPVAL